MIKLIKILKEIKINSYDVVYGLKIYPAQKTEFIRRVKEFEDEYNGDDIEEMHDDIMFEMPGILSNILNNDNINHLDQNEYNEFFDQVCQWGLKIMGWNTTRDLDEIKINKTFNWKEFKNKDQVTFTDDDGNEQTGTVRIIHQDKFYIAWYILGGPRGKSILKAFSYYFQPEDEDEEQQNQECSNMKKN